MICLYVGICFVYLGQLSHFPLCCGTVVTNLNEPLSSCLLSPHRCGLGAGFIPLRAIVNKKQCETRGLFMSLVIHYGHAGHPLWARWSSMMGTLINVRSRAMLRWSSSLLRPTPIYVTSVRRCWQSFDPDVFRTDLLASTLCDVQSHNDLDSDVLALLYDSTITGLLGRQVPAHSVTCRRRPSSLWFDDECRMAKRNVRRLESRPPVTSVSTVAVLG